MFSEPLIITIPTIVLNLFIYFVLILLFSLITYLIYKNTVIDFKQNDRKFFLAFKFGLIYVKSGSQIQKIINQNRKTKDRNFFISVPMWFNNYIYNVSAILESDKKGV